MKAPKRQSLWDLLACASRVRATEEFGQKVSLRVSGVRQHSASLPLFPITAYAAGILVLGLTAAVLLWPGAPRIADSTSTAPASEEIPGQESCTEEFEKVVLMDELLAVNDPTQLDDEALAKLMFR